MSALEWTLLVILSILWGGSFFFNGVVVRELSTLTIVWCRVVLASIILLSVVHLSGLRMPSSLATWRAFLVIGLLNNVIPFNLIVWGQSHIESGLASILNATTPVFSVLIAPLFTSDEKFTTNRIIGVVLGWIGVATLIGVDSLRGLGIEVVGQVAVLGGSLSYAFAAMYGRRFRGLNPLVVAAGMLSCSAVIMTPPALIIEQPWQFSPGTATLLALFGLGAVSTTLAYIIYFRVLSTTGPTNLLLVTFLIPLSAILLGTLILGERLGWNAFVGMTIIFGSLLVIDGRLLHRFPWAQRDRQTH